MSLLILSSGQDKYESASLMEVDESNLPQSAQVQGLQNPASFSNSIMPTISIPKNSEIALKHISFYRNGYYTIGANMTFSVYVGEQLLQQGRKSTVIAAKALKDVTSFPIPIPLDQGVYTEAQLALMMERNLNRYISYPPYFDNIWCLPAGVQKDGTTKYGFIWNFDNGAANAKTSYHASMGTVVKSRQETGDFVWDGTSTYTTTATSILENNSAIMEGRPLDIIGGAMDWDVSACTGGWYIGFTRPTANDGREQPKSFGGGNIFYDYLIRYDQATWEDTEKTVRMYHCVIVDGNQTMREVEYYNNTDAHFTPNLSSYNSGGGSPYDTHVHMYSGAPAALAALRGAPSAVSMQVFGEDMRITVTADGKTFVLTDSRLCIAGNANVLAQTPTRNMFMKPTGTTCNVLYPKISLVAASETAIITKYDGIFSDNYLYPQTAEQHPDLLGATSGNSIWGRSQLTGLLQQSEICKMVDFADPYNSSLTTPQKQYVGLDGAEGETPPVRVGEGIIPAAATGDGFAVAYSTGLITMPSIGNLSRSNIAGVYSSSTTDVSSLFGFPELPQVFSTGHGSTFTYANRDTGPPPTAVIGAMYGWYLGSVDSPIVARGNYFLRCPTLTHQSFNFGKGIPSKIIGSFPNTTAGGRDYGHMDYSPNTMTYLKLNNPSEITLNELSLEIVDKNEQKVGDLGQSTTAVLHIRKSLTTD
tara:strand:+ start:237 stop:2342 length:2106 start_codon:yes stop_codon:yes gene_type:complete